jgi:hypothetical protein
MRANTDVSLLKIMVLSKVNLSDGCAGRPSPRLQTFANYPCVGKVAVANLHYAKPIASAPVFAAWNNITAIDDTTGLRTMGEMADLLN